MHRKSYTYCAWVVALAWCSVTLARPPYLAAWEEKYPTSTLPARMTSQPGLACYTCHQPPTLSEQGNCYRLDLKALIEAGQTITQALDIMDAADSDGDGVPNGIEAITPHASFPGEIGYNQGLIGPTGTDPCATDPGAPVTNVPETPVLPIPTVSQWGIVVMVLMVLAAGTLVFPDPRRVEA